MKRYIGLPLKRVEDLRLIQGRGSFCDDIKLNGMLHAAILRSPYSHAIIKQIDTSQAENLVGVYKVLTGKDILQYCRPWRNPIPGGRYEEIYPLATKKVAFYGHEVALVIAKDAATAKDALEKIYVDYEILPPILDVEESMKDQVIIRDDLGYNSNTSFKYEINVGDVEKAFNSADIVVEERFETGDGFVAPLEPTAIIAGYNDLEGLTVIAPHQAIYGLRRILSESLNLPLNKIRVKIPNNIGGGFGARLSYNPQYVLPAIASYILKKPVKLVLDRSEDMIASPHRHKSIFYLSLAASKYGRILGLKGKIIWDTGASHGYRSGNFIKGILQMPGPYKIENVHLVGLAVMTNKSYTGANRGFPQPSFVFARERLVDIAAKKLHMDPLEFRLINVIKPEEVPYQSVTGIIFDNTTFTECLKKAAEGVGWKNDKRQYVGYGIALYQKNSGGFGIDNMADFESARIKINRDGSIEVYISSIPSGQGHETIVSQIVGEVLQTDYDKIKVIYGDTEKIPEGIGTFGSRTATILGSAVYYAAEKMLEKMKKIAANSLEVSVNDIEYEDGNFYVRGSRTRKISLKDVINMAYSRTDKLPNDTEPALEIQYAFRPKGESFFDEHGRANVASTYEIGAYAVKIEIDPETGEFRILDHAFVTDAGKIINPAIVDGQIIGGFAQGLGYATYENLTWNEEGVPINNNFLNFGALTSMEIPPLTKIIHVTSQPIHIEKGFRGIGESGFIPVAAAIANAISDAINVEFNELPIIPEIIWRKINTQN